MRLGSAACSRSGTRAPGDWSDEDSVPGTEYFEMKKRVPTGSKGLKARKETVFKIRIEYCSECDKTGISVNRNSFRVFY